MPFTFWEIVSSLSLVVAAAIQVTTASDGAEQIGAVVFLLVVVGATLFAVRMHTHRQGLLAQKVPFEILWLVGLVALFFAVSAVLADDLDTRAFNALLAFSGVAAIINEKTREIPEATLSPGSGGYFDQTTSRGRARLDRAFRIGVGVTALGCVGLVVAGSSWGFIGLCGVVGGVLGWEGTRWYASRRKLGYYAYDDEPIE